ncbi:uncharacterized protein CANTADRAFT_314746 [Suhomyces tanzawaensis NRRL Y-17324]|uniref:Uncharacterized protein n=1 Tax=Suhomyces tanzawaensis NRRL Y-17324 TaxID=984487 RepID=A0A1E4SDV2_9ASCO|nr:uncharacterized protein CANTADRAFT_314746 [Suhomyces tanzawaensis NRRL Y-17324]ODV77572.1 hypothetical protein CANTADRAFT_314746 [Suhomyces tanzawaensis NRRL Y-17324]
MSNVVISDLEPPLKSGISGSGGAKKSPLAISIKMSPELMNHLKSCLDSNVVPKLVVKDGNYSIKISNDLIFPCHNLPEHLNVDIYSIKHSQFDGRVLNKLNPITDEKKIKEYNRALEFKGNEEPTVKSPSRSPAKSPSRTARESPTKTHPLTSSRGRTAAYRLKPTDTPSQVSFKFLHLLALGPMTQEEIIQALGLEKSHLSLISDCCQVYDRKNTFIQDDTFPIIERKRRRRIKRHVGNDLSDNENDHDIDSMLVDSDADMDDEDIQIYSHSHYILKDKYYKELKPWGWKFYTKFERTLIIQNIHHALTRLGFSETHPLRKKICNEPEGGVSSDDEKKSTLGGGFLTSNSKKPSSTQVPFKKSHTDSPKIANKLELDNKKGTHTTSNSPAIDSFSMTGTNSKALFPPKKANVGTTSKRKFSSSSSSYSSDEEKNLKKLKVDSYTSPPSSEEIDEDTTPRSIRSGHPSSRPTTGSSSSSSSTSNVIPPEIKSASKRLEYYNSLAVKFKLKYKEYEILYNKLKVPNTSNINKNENKKSLLKLFELHNTLSQWKRTLWDFDNEIKLKSNIMNLSKHKKTNSIGATSLPKDQSTSPSNIGSKIKSQSLSPAIPQLNRPIPNRPGPSVLVASRKPKALDY